jgi:hypothetical protein
VKSAAPEGLHNIKMAALFLLKESHHTQWIFARYYNGKKKMSGVWKSTMPMEGGRWPFCFFEMPRPQHYDM